MKLNQYKIGLTLIVLLSVLLISTTGFAVYEEGNTWVIENDEEFDKYLVGKKVSEVDFGLDEEPDPDIKPGDTIALKTGITYTQTASITINLHNITFTGHGGVVKIEQDLVSESPDTYGNYRTVDVGYTGTPPTGSVVQEDMTSNLVITAEGARVTDLIIESDAFIEAEGDPKSTGFSNAAILVDIEDPCACAARKMEFENLSMPECGDCCDYDFGIRFTGTVEDWGGRNTTYSEIDFHDVRINGVSQNGIEFANSVGDVSVLDFEQMYIANSKDCGVCQVDEEFNQKSFYPNLGGYGLYFDNYGNLSGINLENSQGIDNDPGILDPSEYGIENNKDGIRINGESVEEVSDLEIKNVDIKNNCDNGITIFGRWDPCEKEINSRITRIDMEVVNTEISHNGQSFTEAWSKGNYGDFPGGYGILVGSASYNYSANEYDLYYSTAKLDKVVLEEVNVFNNFSGGAGFFATKVSGDSTSPAFKVLSSNFNPLEGEEETDQAFGLTVGVWEGINGVEISNSTFNNHDGMGGVKSILTGLPDQSHYLGDGIALLASYEDGASDDVENVTITNTDSNANGFYLNDSLFYGNGFRVEGNVVDNVEVTGDGHYNENVDVGIGIVGQDGVNNVSIVGNTDDQGVGELLANSNGFLGLGIASESGDVKGVEVKNGVFGTANSSDNGNGAGGVWIETSESGSIGGSEDADAISFDNLIANANEGHGLYLNAAEDILNPSDNIVVNNSHFNDNYREGIRLEAANNIENPRIEDNTVNGNNVVDTGIAGILIKAGNKVKGSSAKSEIKGNIVADNNKGISVAYTDPPEDEFTDTIVDLAIRGNTTASNDDDYKTGNPDTNIEIAANNLNTVIVAENRIIGFTEVGLRLKASEEKESSAITVEKNIFDSGAVGACIGEGTAIMLNAKKTDIRYNDFKKFDTGIKVLQENENDPNQTASDTSNDINNNNMLDCCITIDAEDLSSADYKVDATSNYWGEGQTPEDIKVNMKAVSSDPLDQIFVEPLLSERVEVLKNFSLSLDLVTSDPEVGEEVEVDYEIANNTATELTVDAQMTVTGPDDETVLDEAVESDITVEGESQVTGTVEFTPEAEGTYTVELSINDGEATKTLDITVDEGTTPEPEEKEPYWGQDGESAKSGIEPAPVDGTTEPYLTLANEAGEDVSEYVTVSSVKVFDLTGERVLLIEDGFEAMSQLNQLKNGLYLYTVEYSVEGGDEKPSPVMKFLVKR